MNASPFFQIYSIKLKDLGFFLNDFLSKFESLTLDESIELSAN